MLNNCSRIVGCRVLLHQSCTSLCSACCVLLGGCSLFSLCFSYFFRLCALSYCVLLLLFCSVLFFFSFLFFFIRLFFFSFFFLCFFLFLVRNGQHQGGGCALLATRGHGHAVRVHHCRVRERRWQRGRILPQHQRHGHFWRARQLWSARRDSNSHSLTPEPAGM